MLLALVEIRAVHMGCVNVVERNSEKRVQTLRLFSMSLAVPVSLSDGCGLIHVGCVVRFVAEQIR